MIPVRASSRAHDTQSGPFLKQVFAQGDFREAGKDLRRLEKSVAAYDVSEALGVLVKIAQKKGIDLAANC